MPSGETDSMKIELREIVLASKHERKSYGLISNYQPSTMLSTAERQEIIL
jgi:hypothetical protein